MLSRAPTALTTASKPSAKPDPMQLKEAKWGSHKRRLVEELEKMTAEGWVVAYTDGSAKRVRGWMQAGYGVWYGRHVHRNSATHVPSHERQSISRGELGGVLRVALSRQPGERMVIKLDSEYVHHGVGGEMEASWVEDVLRGGGAQKFMGTCPLVARRGG